MTSVTCARCGAEVHAWRATDGVCDACVDPSVHARANGDARASERAARVRLGGTWALGALALVAVMAGFVGAIALALHACTETAEPIVAPVVDKTIDHVGRSAGSAFVHDLHEATRSVK